jgi:hypothetical protein
LTSAQGYIIVEDTILDKRYGINIELTKQQYGGNENRGKTL